MSTESDTAANFSILPQGWIERPSAPPFDPDRQVVVFLPENDPSVKFSIVTRKVDAAAFASVREVFEQPPQFLSGARLKVLEHLIGDESFAHFSPLIVRTINTNGKKEMVIEGRYGDDRNLLATFEIAGDRLVYGLVYVAPKTLYPKYLLAAKSIISTIRMAQACATAELAQRAQVN